MAAVDSNSSSRVCVASPLPTEPHLQPSNDFFLMYESFKVWRDLWRTRYLCIFPMQQQFVWSDCLRMEFLFHGRCDSVCSSDDRTQQQGLCLLLQGHFIVCCLFHSLMHDKLNVFAISELSVHVFNNVSSLCRCLGFKNKLSSFGYAKSNPSLSQRVCF